MIRELPSRFLLKGFACSLSAMEVPSIWIKFFWKDLHLHLQICRLRGPTTGEPLDGCQVESGLHGPSLGRQVFLVHFEPQSFLGFALCSLACSYLFVNSQLLQSLCGVSPFLYSIDCFLAPVRFAAVSWDWWAPVLCVAWFWDSHSCNLETSWRIWFTVVVPACGDVIWGVELNDLFRAGVWVSSTEEWVWCLS